jgi:hypothetical protein
MHNAMKSTLVIIITLAISLQLSAQFYAEPKIGMTTRLTFTAYADAGIRSGPLHLAATAAVEQRMGTHTGALIGYMPRDVMFYGGYGYYFANPANKELVSKTYPIAGIQYNDPYGRAVIDFRYQINAFVIAMGVRIGRKD